MEFVVKRPIRNSYLPDKHSGALEIPESDPRWEPTEPQPIRNPANSKRELRAVAGRFEVIPSGAEDLYFDQMQILRRETTSLCCSYVVSFLRMTAPVAIPRN